MTEGVILTIPTPMKTGIQSKIQQLPFEITTPTLVPLSIPPVLPPAVLD